MVRAYQNFHMFSHGWSDIGYSFLVGEDGRAYEGRGWTNVGAHTKGHNEDGLGFCVIGDFTARIPDQVALTTLKALIQCGVDSGYLPQDYVMFGHRDMGDTECPGDRSAVPRQLPGGKWDCSVPFWPDFRDHFACTVDTECAGGEDKITCDDVSSVCGVELFGVGKRCYSYIRASGTHRRIPWNWAREICITRGADLASLNTQDEWQTVLSFLQGQEFDWVFVGLQLASPPLPDIYLDSWQWADETIAFYLTIKGSGKPPPYCAAFHVTNATRLSVVGCQARLSASVLCEMDTESDSPVQDVVTLPSLITNVASASDPEYLFPPTMNVSDSARLVSCPAGHLTRDFLACDVDSACWKLSLDSAAECEAPMTPLPPSFACKHGVGHVPYSSVCDFRPDCVDSSDELCVFPLCSAVSHFKCGNQQCIKKSEKCDGVKHCVNEADEKRCYIQKEFDVDMVYSRAAVDFDGRGIFTANPINDTQPCNDTHFRCPSNGYCLPVHVLCNDVYDCPG
nr:hypothetical protein BaRGS_015606 [Batillaria attramentaria]